MPRSMQRIRLSESGRGQTVRLPKHLRFEGTEVYARKLGNALLLLPIGDPWGPLRESLAAFSEDFMAYRRQPSVEEREGLG